MPGENSTYPVESGIFKNLRYSLDQLKIAGEKVTYMKLVYSVLVGPETVKQSDVEDFIRTIPEYSILFIFEGVQTN